MNRLQKRAVTRWRKARGPFGIESPKSYDAINAMLLAIQQCRPFIGAEQVRVMIDNCRGEEGEWFRAKFHELAAQFASMPKVYQQEGKGEEAIVHLHYFSPSADFYITERDSSTGQHQAYGLADLFNDGGELGYISILELIRAGVEFDLHWTPRTLAQVRKERDGRNPGRDDKQATDEAQALGFRDIEQCADHQKWLETQR